MSFQKRRAYLIAVVFFGIVVFYQAGQAAQAAAPIKIDVKPTILFV
jgi:hypothetical protein